MPAGACGGGSRGGNRTKEVKTKTLEKNALRKQEAEANKKPSAHAAKVLAKKTAAKEKDKARKAANAARKEKAAEDAEDGVPAQERKLGWVDEEGNLDIHGKL